MKLLAVSLTVLGLLIVWATTEHPLALIAVCLAAVWCASIAFRDEPDELAPFSPYQDIEL